MPATIRQGASTAVRQRSRGAGHGRRPATVLPARCGFVRTSVAGARMRLRPPPRRAGRQRRQRGRAVGLQLVDQFAGDLGEPAFVGVGQPGRQLLHRHPRHLGDLDVFVGQLPAGEPHQIMVHGLVHPPALGDEPVVDAAQRGQHAALDPGLLGDLTDGGLLGGLAQLDVALGQRPQHPAAPVDATDQRGDLVFARPVDAVDDQSAGRGFVHGAQPLGPAARRSRRSARVWLRLACSVAGRLPVARRDRRAPTTAAPAPAPTWFGLFAVRHPSDSSWHVLRAQVTLAGCPAVRRFRTYSGRSLSVPLRPRPCPLGSSNVPETAAGCRAADRGRGRA